MIGRKPLPERRSFSSPRRNAGSVQGIRPDFSGLSPSPGQVAYVLLSRLPLARGRSPSPVRLACIRRTASVRPEPGSNSKCLTISFHYPVVKVPNRSTLGPTVKTIITLRTPVVNTLLREFSPTIEIRCSKQCTPYAPPPSRRTSKSLTSPSMSSPPIHERRYSRGIFSLR